MTIKSPFSSQLPEKVRDLPRDFLVKELARYFGAEPPAGAVECDYSVWRCVETGFEFAYPLCPGNRLFYQWISSFPIYYPAFRWEYTKVKELLAQNQSLRDARLSVLDVGCGSGEFLGSLTGQGNIDVLGVDMNTSAVESCRKRGVKAFCGTIEEALGAGLIRYGQFDYVVSFHCLEHVPNPLGFLGEILPLLKPQGRILVSTPCSPMSFESDWFDVMNHPPHHLGRWNANSYKRTAGLLGVDVKFYMPEASSTLARAWQTFRLVQFGAHRRVTKAALGFRLMTHLPLFFGIWRRQCRRTRFDGVTAADVILVELRRK